MISILGRIIKVKPHCYGKMDWILKYAKDNIPKHAICDCYYKNICVEKTLKK